MRILTTHRDDCRAVANLDRGWNSEWWIPGKVEYRRSNGYAGGSRRGLIVECNATDCDARLWVSEDDVLVSLGLARIKEEG